MLVVILVVVVGLFGHDVVGTLVPIWFADVAFFRSSAYDINILFILHPPFEATSFNLIRTCEEFVVEELCYFLAMHPNIIKPSQQGVQGFRKPWCCGLLNN